MIPNPERAAALTVAIGWALIDFLGQGLLVGLVVAAVLRALRSRSADLRYGVACAGLLVMAACPLATALRLATSTPPIDAPAGLAARPAPPEASDRPSAPASPAVVVPLREPGGGPGRSEPAVAAVPSRWPAWVEARLPMVVALWLAGVAIMAGRLALGLVEVRRLSRGGLLAPDGELREAIARLAERAGLRRPVEWFLTLRVEVPTVVGWLRPTVLIPAASVARLSLRQVEALLAHEIAHIRRHDYAVNLIQAAIEAVLFYHPAVWWVSGRIRLERENCCDDAAAALCDGDRLLVARALFAMEEQRSAPGLALAASGGSLKARIRRLVAPSSARPRPAEAGWAVGALLVAASAILASAWLSAPSRAHDEAAGEEAPQDAPESRPVLLIRGRVLDEQGRPIGGARVRLYRRDSRWEHRHPLIKETNAGPDGAFRMVELPNELSMSQSRGLPPYVITADHAGKAVGWATIPIQAKMFEADLVLPPPIKRTVRVVDADGRPVSGARVIAYGVGERSSPEARFRDVLDVRPDDGPLTAETDGDGRAVFTQLPNTAVSYVATKPGYAETFAYHDRNLIRLTPGASLSGRVTGPDGKPVSDVKVVLAATFMWSYAYARTDADGRYRFDDLKAKGWDMSTWTPGQTADGSFRLWLDDERVATTTRSLVLEPNSSQTLNIQGVKPGVIRATVVERGTNRPVAGVRIWGGDAETGDSSRFNAYTDERGQAQIYSVPTTVWLQVVGPPDGSYFAAVNEQTDEGMSRSVTFAGGEQDVAFTIPPLLGKLVAVEGEILLPDGSPAAGATVYAMIGEFHISEPKASYHGRRADPNGRLPIEGLPSGQDVRLYAETADRAFAGDGVFEAPKSPDPSRRVFVRLKRTVAIERVLTGDDGKPLASRKFRLEPRSGDKEFSFARREVQSDAEGRIKVDGIVPGLAYGLDEVDERENPVYISINGHPTGPVMFREMLILAPADGGG